MSGAREAAAAVSREEGDRIAACVLSLVAGLVHGHLRTIGRGVEPTGITVDPVMQDYVHTRCDERKAS